MATKQIFSKLSVGLFFLFLAFSACKKDKDVIAKPTITDLEIGSGNSKTAYPDADVHIEASVLAPGSIANIKVEIHPEGGSGWTFTQIYTEGYEGLKNADLHEHIDIPEDAATGEYHVHITITDKAGNVAEAESALNIIVDPSLPAITGFEVAYDSEDADLHVEGDIIAPNKIAEISLEIHGGSFEKEYEITGDYVGKTTFHLHKHFSLSDVPSGHYHVHLLVKDQAGKEREFEEHFDK
ncbi:DUF4625 domain-containing protein [Agriterribacter sp.]|uniref:DUF4625 domain-containing protein n=1 Tax=Agriterribacter sp. TaxID=2821509 RepID=UPI002B737452|nr:DUF4625 domain-containing protein [Agriterribacter sp.]HRP55446.1 DUF4625 domain-containing protein [Agriterribacter sp.]